MKSGIVVHIPGFGDLDIRILASDYTGTLSCGGKMTRGARQRLIELAQFVDIHILTADTFGTAERELAGLPVALHLLEPQLQGEQKASYVEGWSPEHVAAMGNGNNDRLLLGAVKKAGGLAIAVDNGEGCAVATLQSANLFIVGAVNALDLLIEPARLKATLRS